MRQTMESVFSQGYPNLEYIIIDGGSTDNSVDIIRKYEGKLSFWISEKDDGQSHAIMKGFNKATGELFAWVNSDDILLPGCLNEIRKCYLQREKPDIITANVVYIDAEGKVIKYVRIPRQNRFFFFKGVWYAQAPAIFFKASSFRKVGGLNLKYHLCMDLDIWMKMMQAKATTAHIRNYLGAFRLHEESKTVNFVKRKARWSFSIENIQILSKYIPGISVREVFFWRYVYKLYQVVNFNYIRAYLLLQAVKGNNVSCIFSKGVNQECQP